MRRRMVTALALAVLHSPIASAQDEPSSHPLIDRTLFISVGAYWPDRSFRRAFIR